MSKLRTATDTLKELAVIYSAMLLISAALYAGLEGRSFFDSLYWAGTTATSTGYGDVIPQTMGGRALAFGLMHLSIFGVAPLIIVRLIDRLNADRDAFTHEEQEQILAGITRIEEALERAGIAVQSKPGADVAPTQVK